MTNEQIQIANEAADDPVAGHSLPQATRRCGCALLHRNSPVGLVTRGCLGGISDQAETHRRSCESDCDLNGGLYSLAVIRPDRRCSGARNALK